METETLEAQQEKDDCRGAACSRFSKFYDTIRTLRGPEGCPWDKAQTPETMRADIFEEVCELVSAINEKDFAHVAEELGDVFLCAAMISYMFEQSGDFSVADVFEGITEKLIRRHPHVFKESETAFMNETPENPEQVLHQWEKIKQNYEKRGKAHLLDELDGGLPPLLLAYKLQKKAAKKGFDWPDAEGAMQKVAEELDELRRERDAETRDEAKIEEEVGDLLFAAVNCARKLGVHPDVALVRANEKFRNRFNFVEDGMKAHALDFETVTLERLDAFWDEAKRLE